MDALDNVRYEAHHYWDADHSSLYKASYAEATAGLGPEVRPIGADPFSWTSDAFGGWHLP